MKFALLGGVLGFLLGSSIGIVAFGGGISGSIPGALLGAYIGYRYDRSKGNGSSGDDDSRLDTPTPYRFDEMDARQVHFFEEDKRKIHNFLRFEAFSNRLTPTIGDLEHHIALMGHYWAIFSISKEMKEYVRETCGFNSDSDFYEKSDNGEFSLKICISRVSCSGRFFYCANFFALFPEEGLEYFYGSTADLSLDGLLLSLKKYADFLQPLDPDTTAAMRRVA